MPDVALPELDTSHLRIDHLTAVAAKHAEHGDTTSCLDQDVIDAIRGSGLIRHFVPHSWGGKAGSFTAIVRPLAQLAEADPSAAWCAAIMASMSRGAAFLPLAARKALWQAGPDILIAGTLQPSGRTTPTDDGWILTGEWPFVSGVDHADWALLCTTIATSDRDELRFMLVPRAEWTITPNWNSIGLRATGSHTLALATVQVPSEHSFPREALFAGAWADAKDLHHAPYEAVSGLFFTTPLLGAARALLTAVTAVAAHRPPASPEDLTLANAAGRIAAAELLITRAAATADQQPEISPELIVQSRLDYTTAADLLVGASQGLFQQAGAHATTRGGDLPRLWRDIQTASVHPALNLLPVARAYARIHINR